MARSRTVDTPRKTYSTTKQAAKWLGWSEDNFRAAVREQSAWLAPSGVKGPHGVQLWFWLDLVCLANIYRRRGPPQQSEREESEEN